MRRLFISPDPELPARWVRALSRLPLLAYRALRWRALRGGWLPDYLRRHRFDRRSFAHGQIIDVIVLTADHYEPAKRFGDAAAEESVRSWCAAYETMARRHSDADGRPPQHTWFYRYDYPNENCVRALSDSAFRGFGEIEFHLHHGHDTHETMAATLRDGLNWFGRRGAMRTAEKRPRQLFGYVAGNSALDNGAGDDSLSGCDTEIAVLRDAGCYADFTFPSLGSRGQPRKVNAHYYVTEDGRPKSHDNGVDVEVGREPSGDLMIFQGPVSINWRTGAFEEGALENSSRPHPQRLAGMLAGNVHVAGRPEWIFVKTQTHAMQNRDAFLSEDMDAMYDAMETWWNQPPFRLHYVTAREAYNIVKAAEAGCGGDPNDYRDYLIPPPANRVISCNLPWMLHSYTPDRIHLEVLQEGLARLEFAGRPLRSITGKVREVEAEFDNNELIGLRIEGEGPFDVECGDEAAVEPAARCTV